MRKFWLSLIVLTVLFAGISFGQGPLTNALNLMVRTDSNGSLYVYGVAAGAQGPLTNFGNIRLRTYNGGDLGVTINGGTITPSTILLGNGTAAAPSLSFSSDTNTGVRWVSADAFAIVNAGFDYVLLDGNFTLAADTNFGWSTTNSNAIAARDTGFSRLGAASVALGNGTAGSFTGALKLTTLNVAAGSTLAASADKLTQIKDNGGTTGMELNVGTPTLGTCTGGSLTSGSHNFGGEVTGNTSGSCVLNFGTPNFTNTPFCMLNDESSLTAVRISARSASSITITGVPSGEAVQYFCIGRIGV